MKSNWKKSAGTILAALFVMGTAGCGGGDKKVDTGKVAVAKNSLKVGVADFTESPESAGNNLGLQFVRYGIGETLIKFDKNMNVIPWLAESWKISGDKLIWTFKIKDKATFSSGNKVTGDAAAKSLRRTFEKAALAKAVFEYDSIEGEGQNVIIKTKYPVPALPKILGDPLWMITDTSIKDRDNVKMGPVGTGPYTVKTFSKTKCMLERNENYWDGKAPFKNLEIHTIDESKSRAMALKKGEIDVAVNVASGDLGLFRDDKHFRVSECDSVSCVLARLTVKEGRTLSDKRIREALASALDRQTYCKVLLKDTFISGGPVLPPSVNHDFDALIKLDKNQYNVGRTRKLLAEAGWKDTNNDGFVDKNGKNLELDCYFCGSHAEHSLFAEATRSDAKKAGIRVNLKIADSNEIDKLDREGTGDLCISHVLTVQGDTGVFMDTYIKTGKKGSGYSNVRYDELSDKLAVEFDPAKRRALMVEMEKAVLEEVPVIVYGYPRTNIISKTEIANADIQPCDYYWITKDWKPAANDFQ